VHSRLIRLGLLEYAKGLDGDWLFPALKPGGPDKKRGWYMSRAFGTRRRALGVVRLDPKTGKDTIDFHSFRRTAIKCLENARVPQSEAAQVVGHERAGITFSVHNPDGLELRALQEIIEKVRYKGLT
jgi:integrase